MGIQRTKENENKGSSALETFKDETTVEPEHDQTQMLVVANETRQETEASIGTSHGPQLSPAKDSRLRWVPYVMFASSFISSAGSGMTVKYIPLYFKDDCGMAPSQVQMMYVFTPISMTVVSAAGYFISRAIGRVPTMLIYSLVSVSLFYVIATFYHPLEDQHFLLALLFVLQSGIGDAVYPLAESLLMDAVPRNQRARWRALQSMAEYGWSGSAGLGGIISDRGGYQQAFFVSCYIELFAIFLFSFLLFLVPSTRGRTP